MHSQTAASMHVSLWQTTVAYPTVTWRWQRRRWPRCQRFCWLRRGCRPRADASRGTGRHTVGTWWCCCWGHTAPCWTQKKDIIDRWTTLAKHQQANNDHNTGKTSKGEQWPQHWQNINRWTMTTTLAKHQQVINDHNTGKTSTGEQWPQQWQNINRWTMTTTLANH